MRTVQELIEYIESQYTIGQSTRCARAITGEPYVVVGWQGGDELPYIAGTVDEGKPTVNARTEQSAIEIASASFKIYKSNTPHGRTLYWRVLPTLEESEGRYRVYMRCLISDSTNRREPCENCNCGYRRPE